MSASESFDLSFRFFQENRESLVKQYKGKIIAVYLDRVLGEYDSKKTAFLEVPEQFGIPKGSFIIEDMSYEKPKNVRIFQSKVFFSSEL